jgi:hypothetical protein
MFLFSKSPHRLWGPPSLLFNRYRGYFPGVKRSGCELHHPPPSSAEAKNEWSCTSTPLYVLMTWRGKLVWQTFKTNYFPRVPYNKKTYNLHASTCRQDKRSCHLHPRVNFIRAFSQFLIATGLAEAYYYVFLTSLDFPQNMSIIHSILVTNVFVPDTSLPPNQLCWRFLHVFLPLDSFSSDGQELPLYNGPSKIRLPSCFTRLWRDYCYPKRSVLERILII